jgi:hypothetical protein
MNEFIKKGDKELRKRNLARAGNRCELCPSTYQLDNHHLLPKSIYPQHRFEPMNTVILCRLKCHDMAENHPIDFAEEFETNANLQDRADWVNEHKGIGKYPSSVDYEKMYNELMESE